MEKVYQKASFVFSFSIFLHLLYHTALLSKPGDPLSIIFIWLGRIGWIGSDLLLFVVGYFCVKLFLFDNQGVINWGKLLFKIILWMIPIYYLFLTLYLTLGVNLLNHLGNHFIFRSIHLKPLFLFYVNIILSQESGTGVALEGMFLLSMGLQLFFGFGLILSISRNKHIIPFLAIFFWVAAIVLRLVIAKVNIWSLYFNTFTRLDSFIGGMLLAYIYDNDSTKEFITKRKTVMLIIGLVSFLIAALSTNGFAPWHPLNDHLSYPALTIFSFAIANWTSTARLPSSFDIFIKYNRVIFVVFLIKLPVLYMVKVLVDKFQLTSLLRNFVFVSLAIVTCYTIAIVWDKTINRLLDFNIQRDR